MTPWWVISSAVPPEDRELWNAAVREVALLTSDTEALAWLAWSARTWDSMARYTASAARIEYDEARATARIEYDEARAAIAAGLVAVAAYNCIER